MTITTASSLSVSLWSHSLDPLHSRCADFLGNTKLDTEDFKALAEKVHNDNCILFWEKDFEETNTCGTWVRVFIDFEKEYARRTMTGF